jgi:hypothetical protein
MRSYIFVAICLATLLSYTPLAQADTQPVIMGWVEQVYIPSIDSVLKAKLDTGAETSSIRAEVLKIVRNTKTKKRKVIFKIQDQDGKEQVLERKVVRFVRIKKKDGGFLRRPTVLMDFCIAGRHADSEVNLASREDFIYPVLVGRNMLDQADILVDANRVFTAKPQCVETFKTDTK